MSRGIDQVSVDTGVLTQNLRFPGQWIQAETGLHQNWMRDYDPTTGRYLQADPLGLIVGPSIYGYALQRPTIWLDPDGLCPCGVSKDVIDRARADQRNWRFDADRSDVHSSFPSRTYKCNLFVDTMYEESGYHLPNIGGAWYSRLFARFPPGARSLSDSNFVVPEWPVVPGPARAGDLIAMDGHSGIATSPSTTISAAPSGKVENDWGLRPGDTAVIRRCSCSE